MNDAIEVRIPIVELLTGWNPAAYQKAVVERLKAAGVPARDIYPHSQPVSVAGRGLLIGYSDLDRGEYVFRWEAPDPR